MFKINVKSAFFICCIFISINTQAQGINFQGVARSANGVILASQKISLKLSIIASSSTGNTEYVESRIINTNAQGIFSIIIGDTGAISTTGNFTGINWKQGPKFLKVEMDPNAGTNFINMGTTQLQNVPYSFYTYGIDASNISGIVPIKSGGTGVSSIAELKTSLNIDKIDNISDLNKPISNAVQTNLNLKLDKSDTTSLFSKIDVKLNKSDTNFLSNRINLKLDKSDTTSLFSKIDVKLNKSDTNFLSNRINLKLDKYDTTSLFSKIDLKLNKSDTNFLSNRINLKLDKSDTTSLFSKIDVKLNKSDTNFLSNRINQKLNKPDTSDLIINQITAGKGNNKIISNTVFGIDALKLNTTGYGNVAIGEYTLSKNTTGYNNTVVGSYAQNSNTSGSNNVAVGKSSLRNNTTGNNNTSVGSISLEKNTTGNDNSAFGENALNLNTIGNNNTALGANTLSQNLSGTENVAVGSMSLANNTTGRYNVGVGYNSLRSSLNSDGNTAIGNNSLNANTTGADNVSIGSNSSLLNTSGNGNISIGSYALQKNITGINNIAIGYNADVATSALTNAIAIGYNSKNSNSNTIVLGNSQITSLITSGKITTGAITLPNTDGTSGQVLATNGSGIVGWTTPATSSNSNSTDLTGIIVFEKNTINGNEIWKSNFDGTSQSKINIVGLPTNYEIAGGSQRISADGKILYFLLYTPTGGQHIYKCNIDGSGLTKIVNDVDEFSSLSGIYTPVTTTSAHYIGELYGGGIIVSVWKKDGIEHGLIASLSDLNSGNKISWSNINTNLIGANAQSINNGQSNTNSIITQSGHTASAAKLCDIYSNGGYSDWYLPSLWELKECFASTFIVNEILGNANGFKPQEYWSSTEGELGGEAWGFDFKLAITTYSNTSKSNQFKVRAVRKF